MLSMSHKAMRSTFRLQHLFLLVAVASVVAFLGSVARRHVRINEQQAQLNEQVDHARSNLKQIGLALQAYQDANRTLPYSDKGDDAALYALKQLVAPAVFECRLHNNGRPRARWDERARRLANGDVAYLNEPHTQLDSARVVITCNLDYARQLYVTGNSVVWGRIEAIPPSQLLGSWVTDEGFLVADKSTFDKWCETHPVGECVERQGIGGRPDPAAARFKDGSWAQYAYVDGRLTGSKVTAANGRVVHEVVETDRWGRIVGISRSLED